PDRGDAGRARRASRAGCHPGLPPGHRPPAAQGGRGGRADAAAPPAGRRGTAVTAPAPGIDGFRTPRATCLLAPNRSPMTLEGTNSWLIAEPGSSSVVVVDPGPDDEDHLGRVHAAAVAGDRRVAKILLTHGHPDHSAGAARFAALTGAP